MTAFPEGTHPLSVRVNQRVLAVAANVGARVYLVGGYLRDALSGRLEGGLPAKDLDYAVEGGAGLTLAQAVAEELSGHFVLLDEANDTARVVLDDGVMLDFSGCVGGDIQADLRRRDFTINALCWDPERPDEVIDSVGGLDDLAQVRIRAIAESNFADDPLRILRAFRFAATLNGTIDGDTLAMLARHADLIPNVASERISYELFLTAQAPNSSRLFASMGDAGVLESVFPELVDTRKVTPNAYHHLGLWDHSIEAVSQAEQALARLDDWVINDLSHEVCPGVTRLAATKVAALLHDIGKPDTWEITPEGRHTFYGHDRVGADMAEEAAKRLRWAKPLERLVVKLIRWHLRPGQLFHQGQPTDRAVHRFYRTVGDDVPPLMVLAFGDLGATRGPGLEGANRDNLERSLIELLDGFPVFLNATRSQVKMLDGNDVMRLLGIDPGPVLGEMLDALTEAQGLNEVVDRASAERFVRDLYSQKYSK